MNQDVYFTDRFNHSVIRWNPTTGESASMTRPGELSQPYGLAFDHAGNLLIADKLNNRFCRLRNGSLEVFKTHDPDGHRIGRFPHLVDSPCHPTGIMSDPAGGYFAVYSQDCTIYHIDERGGLKLLLGMHGNKSWSFEGMAAHIPESELYRQPLFMPTGMARRSDGALFFIERKPQNIRWYESGRGLRYLFPLVEDHDARAVPEEVEAIDLEDFHPCYPTGIAFDAEDVLHIADTGQRCIWRIDTDRGVAYKITRSSGDPFRAGPFAFAFSPDGDCWFVDQSGVRGIRRTTAKSIWPDHSHRFNHSSARYPGHGKSGGIAIQASLS